MPGGYAFDILYPATAQDHAPDEDYPAFTPAFAASVQVAEVVEVLRKKGADLEGKLLLADLFTQQYEIVALSQLL